MSSGEDLKARPNYHRELFLLSGGLFRLITSTIHFRKVVYIMLHAIYECTPIWVTLLVICVEYSALALLLFRDFEITSDTGNQYFFSLGISVFTHFQLFIGEGWHDIMYSTVEKTDITAIYFFISYIILVTILFGNLFLGVLIDVYHEVEQVESINLDQTLEIGFKHHRSDERSQKFKMLCHLLEELSLLPDPFSSVHSIHFDADDKADVKEFIETTSRRAHADADGTTSNGSSTLVEMKEASKLAEGKGVQSTDDAGAMQVEAREQGGSSGA